MSYMWSPDLETGNTVVDNQHKQLITAVNTLFDAYQNGRERQEVERTLDFLVGYTLKHFADEEELQRKCEYPDYHTHQRAHTEFKAVVRELARELHQTGPTDELINRVYVTAGDWLIHHIKGYDFLMASYIQGQSKD